MWAQWDTKSTSGPSTLFQAPLAQCFFALFILQKELMNSLTGANIAPQKHFVPYRAREPVLERGFNALQCSKLRLAPISMDLTFRVREISPVICKGTFPTHAGHSLTRPVHGAVFSRAGYSPPSLSESPKSPRPRSHGSAWPLWGSLQETERDLADEQQGTSKSSTKTKQKWLKH